MRLRARFLRMADPFLYVLLAVCLLAILIVGIRDGRE